MLRKNVMSTATSKCHPRRSVVGRTGTVVAMASYHQTLVIGGAFSRVDGIPARNLARWNGTTWEELGGGTDGTVSRLQVFQGALYAAGRFSEAGGIASAGIAKWTEASSPGTGPVLLASGPNPFSATTTIRFTLPALQPVRLTIHDALGRTVRTLGDGPLVEGPHWITWDGTDGGGRLLPAGVYFSRLTPAGGSQAQSLRLYIVR